MKICISHWKIRIRPGISEFIFFFARQFSIRQLLFHFLFLQLCCWKHPQKEKYCGKPEKRPVLLCPYFTATGADSWCGMEEWGGLNEAHWDRSSPVPTCHLQSVSQQWYELDQSSGPPMPHWTLIPSKKGSGNTSFKYKTPFWCLNIWHPLETIPKTYKNYFTLL